MDDLNEQALAWCRKVNNRVHVTTNKIPAQQLAEECLQPMLREYITDKMNDRKVEKDCLISYAGNKEHYRPLMTRQTFHVKNTMIHGPEIIDYSIVPDDLSQYNSLIGGGFDE